MAILSNNIRWCYTDYSIIIRFLQILCILKCQRRMFLLVFLDSADWQHWLCNTNATTVFRLLSVEAQNSKFKFSVVRAWFFRMNEQMRNEKIKNEYLRFFPGCPFGIYQTPLTVSKGWDWAPTSDPLNSSIISPAAQLQKLPAVVFLAWLKRNVS